MAYSNALASVIAGNEHNAEPPAEYSFSNYRPNFTKGFYRFELINYRPSQYNPYKYDNYAGSFRTVWVKPTIIPDVDSNYTGIAPYGLMPEIVRPYPYEQSFNKY